MADLCRFGTHDDMSNQISSSVCCCGMGLFRCVQPMRLNITVFVSQILAIDYHPALSMLEHITAPLEHG